MTSEVLIQYIDTWVTQYIAIFCLLTILAWGVGSYFFLDKWEKPVRDAALYFVVTAVLAVVLFLRPSNIDVLLWTPITWFAFSMLLVMELLWVTYLADGLLHLIQSIPQRYQRFSGNTSGYRDGLPRP